MTPPQPTDSLHYRHDIDGLRAVAVLLVVVYHVWLGRVSGGVDAFLIISAFLLTDSLLRQLERTGQVRPIRQWIRNFKRLLPAAAIVILATAIVGFAVLPASAMESLWRHTLASIFYVENWLLASESVDYYANNAVASPLQHFWSLSVQGQVFILWPILFLVIALATKFFGRKRVRTIALIVFGVVFASSLVYSIIITQANQELAYFNTAARLWEFAAGSILAIVIPWISLGVIPRAVLGWVGVVALLTCGLVLDVQSGFPGYLALWPVLSVAAIIIAGSQPNRRYGPAVFLEAAPVLFLGRVAYALYLVHWPLLIYTLFLLQVTELSFLQGLALIGVAILLALLLTLTVDAPLRRLAWIQRSTWRGVLVIVVSVLLVVVPTIGMQQATQRQVAQQLEEVQRATQEAQEAAKEEAAAVQDLRNPGAAVLSGSWEDDIELDAPMRPLAAEVPTQWGTLPRDCSDGSLMDLPKSIEICFDNDTKDAERTILVVGNSHAQQMLAPIGAIADAQGWHAISFLYAACAFGLREVDEDRGIFYSQQCRDWNEDVLDLAEKIQPDAVITVGTETIPADMTMRSESGDGTDADGKETPELSYTGSRGSREHVLEGVERSIERLERAGIPVILIRDNPRFTENAYVCAEQFADLDPVTGSDRSCTIPRIEAYLTTNPADALASDTTAVVDLSDLYCPGDECPAVIGNTFVYIDDNHLSLVYGLTLATMLEPHLTAALEQFDGSGTGRSKDPQTSKTSNAPDETR